MNKAKAALIAVWVAAFGMGGFCAYLVSPMHEYRVTTHFLEQRWDQASDEARIGICLQWNVSRQSALLDVAERMEGDYSEEAVIDFFSEQCG